MRRSTSFVADPKAYLPGTKMSYGGVKKAETARRLIAYLRTLSDTPAPLPEAPAQASPEPPTAPESASETSARRAARNGTAP